MVLGGLVARFNARGGGICAARPHDLEPDAAGLHHRDVPARHTANRGRRNKSRLPVPAVSAALAASYNTANGVPVPHVNPQAISVLALVLATGLAATALVAGRASACRRSSLTRMPRPIDVACAEGISKAIVAL